MTSRRKSRELAFIALYQLEVGRYDMEELIKDTIQREEISTSARPWFRSLIRHVWKQRTLFDALINHAAEGWRVERINKLDLSLLRLATCELTTPILEEVSEPPVVISEAVILAKRYCGEENAKFANGILGKVSALQQPLKLGAKLLTQLEEQPERKTFPKVEDPLAARREKLLGPDASVEPPLAEPLPETLPEVAAKVTVEDALPEAAPAPETSPDPIPEVPVETSADPAEQTP